MRYQDKTFQQRESELLSAARELFQTQPWDRVTIAEVARQAGIGKGTVYKHFPSKEALYARLVLDRSRLHLSALTATAEEGPAADALHRSLRLAFDQLLADPLHAQLCLQCDRPAFQARLEPEYRAEFCALEGEYLDLFNRLLHSRFADLQLTPSDCEQLLWGVEACVNGVMARIASGGFDNWPEPFDLKLYFDRVTDFALAGLQGQAAALGARTSHGE